MSNAENGTEDMDTSTQLDVDAEARNETGSEQTQPILSPEPKDEDIGLQVGTVFPHRGVGSLMEIVRVTRVVVHYRVAANPDSPSWVLGRKDFLNEFQKDLIIGHPYRPIPSEFR